MFFFQKFVDKVVVQRIITGEQTLNQNMNMALSHYGINLKELKVYLDELTDSLPKGWKCYLHFVIYTNGSYDIFLKGPTLSSCITQTLFNINSAIDNFNVNFEELVLFHNVKLNFQQNLTVSLFDYEPNSLYLQYKQLLGTINSYKTI